MQIERKFGVHCTPLVKLRFERISLWKLIRQPEGGLNLVRKFWSVVRAGMLRPIIADIADQKEVVTVCLLWRCIPPFGSKCSGSDTELPLQRLLDLGLRTVVKLHQKVEIELRPLSGFVKEAVMYRPFQNNILIISDCAVAAIPEAEDSRSYHDC